MDIQIDKGVWLLPSRGRPHNLARFFDSVRAVQTRTEGLVLLNREDFDDRRAEYDALSYPDGWSLILCEGDSQGDKIREVEALWRDLAWVGLLGDDEMLKTEAWDRTLVGHLDGKNFVSCNDDWVIHTRGGRIAGCILWSGELLRTVGYIFPPGMHHILLDDIWEEIGKETGCWHVDRDVMIQHLHFENGGAKHDDTYRAAYAYGVTDHPIHNEWREHHLAGVVAKIRALQQRG